MQHQWSVHIPLHELRTWTQPLKRTSMSKLRKNFTKSSLCSNYHYLPPLSNLYMLALAPGFWLSALSYQSNYFFSSSILIPCSLCFHHWHPSHLFAVPIPLVHLCSPCSVWPQLFLLSGSLLLALSFLWVSILVSFLALLLPGPTSWPLHASWLLLLLPAPPLWFSLPGLFWPKVRDAEECGKEWMGKEDEGSRGMGCNGLCLCLSYHLPLSQAYLVPHTYVNMNCNIINIF